MCLESWFLVEYLFVYYLLLLFAGVIVWKEYCGGFLMELVVDIRKEYYRELWKEACQILLALE